MTGTLAAWFLPWVPVADNNLVETSGFLSYWAHWNEVWYSEIATEGYGSLGVVLTTTFVTWRWVA